MLWILVAGAGPISTAGQGKTLFSLLSGLAFVYCLLAGAFVTSDCLSVEKREGTIGLLFLTALNGYDVVLGKLVSSSLHCVYGLIAVLPMISMALLFGGVSPDEITATALVLGNTLFFSLSVGMFVSTLSRNDRRAAFITIFLILLVTAGPYWLGFALATNFGKSLVYAMNEKVLPPSPAFAFNLAQSPVGAVASYKLYVSLALTQLLAWIFLGLSCVIIPRVCKDRPKGVRRELWGQKGRQWRLGDQEERAAFRHRLLEGNPCFWLAGRERHKASLVWFLVVTLAGVGAWVCLNYRNVFFETSLCLLFVTQVLLKVWFAGETCQRWVEDRECGALELLLSTPLRARDLIHGQGMALRRQFGWPVAVVLAFTLATWIIITARWSYAFTMPSGKTWLWMSAPVLLADLAALRWVGAWQGLTAHGLNRAITETVALVLGMRWVIYWLGAGLANAWEWLGLGQIGFLASEGTWFFLALFLDFYFGWSARQRFLHCLRAVAANPTDYRNAVRLMAVEAELKTDTAQTPSSPQVEWVLRKRKRRRLAWAATLVALVVGMPWGYRSWLQWQIDHRLQTLQKAGVPLTFEELDRRRPSLTNEVNAAEVMAQAVPRPGPGTPYAMSMVAFKSSSPNRGGPLREYLRTTYRHTLTANQAALAIIHAAPTLSAGRYAIPNAKPGIQNYSIQAQAAWTICQYLQSEVFIRGDEGDMTGALDSLHRILDIGRSMKHEQAMIFQQTRMSCFDLSFLALEWLLSRSALPEVELKSLQKQLAEIETETDLQLPLAWWRCMMLEQFRYTPMATSFTGPGSTGTMDQIRMQLQARLYGLMGGKKRDLIQSLDTLEEFERRLQLPYPERYRQAHELASKHYISLNTGRRFSLVMNLGFTLDFLIASHTELIARCRAALIGIAIEQYRLRHQGGIPERLDQLVPVYIRELALDPFNGLPMRYKRLDTGYCVYSVGKNGVDNGGAGADPPQQGRLGNSGDDIAFSVER